MRRQKPTRQTERNASSSHVPARSRITTRAIAAIARPLLATVLLITGCSAPSWRPPMQGVEQAPAALRVDLSGRRPPPNTRYIYQRVARSTRAPQTQDYPVVHLTHGTREGAFAETQVPSLTSYFARDASKGRELDGSLWPQPWINGTAGLLLRFEQPFVHLPDMLDANDRWRQKTRVDIHDPKGRRLFTAGATRDIEFEGYETVTIGDQSYPDCVRLCAKTRIHLPWVARVDIDEYLWFAPSKGYVRRIQAVRGSVFFRYFEDVVEDQLQRTEAISAAPSAQSALNVHDPGVWEEVVFFFNPSWPKPHLAGVIVDYAPLPGWVTDDSVQTDRVRSTIRDGNGEMLDLDTGL